MLIPMTTGLCVALAFASLATARPTYSSDMMRGDYMFDLMQDPGPQATPRTETLREKNDRLRKIRLR